MVEDSSDLRNFYGNYGTLLVVLNTPLIHADTSICRKSCLKKQSMQKKQKGQCLENKRLLCREQKAIVLIINGVSLVNR